MYKKIFFGMLVFGLLGGYTFAVDRNLPGISIVTRSQWGADESWRYSTLSKTERDKIRQQQQDAQLQLLRESGEESADGKLWETLQQRYMLQIANDFLVAGYPEEQKVDEIRESINGKYLKWPESIHLRKNKIVIHHTAEDYSALLTGGTEEVKKQLQHIYKYHALTQGWGDIGYNFIIAPDGTIYEGRAGGAGVVGAHASRNNTPTVGVALMGNFEIQKPTDKQLQSLVRLLTALTKKYSINPLASASYFKKASEPPYLAVYKNYSIAGHKDAGVTACPGVNLYALLPEIREQVHQAMKAPVSVQKQAPAKPKIQHGLVVDGWYFMEGKQATFTLPIRRSGVSSCVPLDSGFVIHSCRSVKGEIVMNVEKHGFGGIKGVSVQTSSGKQSFSFLLFDAQDLLSLVSTLKQQYLARKGSQSSSSQSMKISNKVYSSQITHLLQSSVRVLLYELTKSYTRFELSCDGGCVVLANGTSYVSPSPVVETSETFIYLSLPQFESPLQVPTLSVSSQSSGLVRIVNYPRKSYAGVPWNVFRGSLVWTSGFFKDLSRGSFVDQALVINELPFDSYLGGIAETSDADHIEKQKTIMLLAKMYALFYLDGQNNHPSIPSAAPYNAIDNPDMFQKYVGAGWEKTSKYASFLSSSIKNLVILYDGYVPILPYFSCSAGFTWSAKEKRGRSDTPYLVSRLDFASCFDFNGHGVGLSGKGAQVLADKGRSMHEILQYYYPGISLIDL